jgi:hypothetical protein
VLESDAGFAIDYAIASVEQARLANQTDRYVEFLKNPWNEK